MSFWPCLIFQAPPPPANAACVADLQTHTVSVITGGTKFNATSDAEVQSNTVIATTEDAHAASVTDLQPNTVSVTNGETNAASAIRTGIQTNDLAQCGSRQLKFKHVGEAI